MTERKTRSRLTGGIVAVIVLAVCLVVTTVALAYSMISVRDNTFATGGVRINLNDGEPVIRPDEFLFEPGMTVKKDFFIENDSTGTVYYRLYFAGVSGDLGGRAGGHGEGRQQDPLLRDPHSVGEHAGGGRSAGGGSAADTDHVFPLPGGDRQQRSGQGFDLYPLCRRHPDQEQPAAAV